MRFAYLVDVHSRFPAVTQALEQVAPVDLLVLGGDITNFGTPDRVDEAIYRWQSLAPRVLAVAGNVDSVEIDDRLVDLGVALNARGVRVGDAGFFGVSGAPHSFMHTPYELDEDELGRRAEAGWADVRDCRFTVFCPHAPPRDTACDVVPDGKHVGSTAVRAFVEREQPDLVLCGHIHSARGSDTIGRSQVVNPGPANEGHYAVVEIADTVSVELDG